VYGSLGNNDSGCTDYRATPGDTFLRNAGGTLAAAAGLQPASITPEGDYSVPLPAPMEHARLIVLEDIFEARQFATCGGNSDRTAERTQLDWLRTQLAAARASREHVWLMSHIPPGTDVYTSFHRYVLRPAEMCQATPRPFLADTAIADTLLDYADIVRLALFGHTHMDEIRLLHRNDPTGDEVVPAKLVPSVSPYLGNHPAFLVAQVDPRTAVLKDWRTFVSPGPEGSTPPWTEAYRYTTTYHLPDFSAQSAARLADSFVADKTGQAPASTAFRQHFYPGDFGLYAVGLAQIWPAYACSVRENRSTEVQKCVCAALPVPAPDSTQPKTP
jgi:sphingomyelin phosphodiesterase acid-like 3